MYCVACGARAEDEIPFCTGCGETQFVLRPKPKPALLASRIAAFSMDGFFVGLLQMVWLFGICRPVMRGRPFPATLHPRDFWTDIDSDTKLLIAAMATTWFALIPWLYFTLQECSPWNATLGKRILGMRVATSDGGPVSFFRSTIRYWLRSLSVGLWIPAAVSVLLMAFSANNNPLHDRIAGTRVVRD